MMREAASTASVRPALRPYESILTPVITLILDAITQNCAVGGSFAPGVRILAEWAGVSEGAVSPNLYTLADDGWITYDGHVIMLLRSPDQWIDQGDQSVDRPIDQSLDRDQGVDQQGVINPLIGGAQRSRTRKAHADQRADRSAPHMVNHDLAAAAESKLDSAAAISLKLPCADKNDQAADRLPAALFMAELGCDDASLRAEILAHYPDLTRAQLGEQWALAQDREKDGYTDNARRLLFGTLRKGGWLYGRTVDRTQPVTAADLPPQSEPDEAAMHAAYHRARALAPPGLSHQAMTELIYALLDGATDDQALSLIRAGGAP